MPWSIKWSGAAEADLDDIWLHIAQENPAAADRQADRIADAIRRLADYPRLGEQRDDIALSLRALVKDNYLILYETEEAKQRVTIKRIIHSRRDIAELLRASGD
jgi:toxin ParE1/3/4